MDYLEIAAFIGTFAFALSGALVGIRKNLDIMGVFILAFLTSSGGGAIRDVCLNKTPAFLVDITPYIITILIIMVFKFLAIDHVKHRFEERVLFIVSDTAGLIAFAINGALQGIMSELSFFGVLTICFITSVGGGIIRDMLINDIPSTLQLGFYGSIAIIIGSLVYMIDYLGLDNKLFIPLIFVFGIVLRLGTYHKNVRLPRL
jgi:uncharacterized membrane protein YeiH